MPRRLGCIVAVLCVAVAAIGAEQAPMPRLKIPETPKMPLSGLVAAKPMFDACVYHYAVGTTNSQCQAFVDQGLGMYYSYVWMEAARAFETAITLDPDCAYAWLMLHRSLSPDHYGKSGMYPTAA